MIRTETRDKVVRDGLYSAQLNAESIKAVIQRGSAIITLTDGTVIAVTAAQVAQVRALLGI